MNRIKIDPERVIGDIDRNIFGLFKENRPMYMKNGIYDPKSKFADEQGFRKDVIEAARRIKCPILRCIGGNTISGYRWMDAVGPKEERTSWYDLAWGLVDYNQIGTNEYIDFCRKINAEPYFVVNCGDGNMREASDWVQYCNGTQDTTLVKLRKKHGYENPHNIKYWGIGNEVDGHWQIGYKTAEEYARAYAEYAKVMKWSDPSIKLFAAYISDWKTDFTERAQLLFEHAGNFIDYMAIHWYYGNPGGRADMPGTPEKREAGFESYMAVSEIFEERIKATEGIINAGVLENQITNPVYIALDEWAPRHQPGENIDLPQRVEDALTASLNFNAVIRHADTVKMASLSGLSRRLVLPGPDSLLIQSSYYPYLLYSNESGQTALDVFWDGDTFSGWDRAGIRTLDVTATFTSPSGELTVFVVNRSKDKEIETAVSLCDAEFKGDISIKTLNGPSVDSANTFENPNVVGVKETKKNAGGKIFNYAFEPHSLTVLSGKLGK
jgi:alpha-N-arabinofuranosidase